MNQKDIERVIELTDLISVKSDLLKLEIYTVKDKSLNDTNERKTVGKSIKSYIDEMEDIVDEIESLTDNEDAISKEHVENMRVELEGLKYMALRENF